MNPLDRVFHHAAMPDDVFKVMVSHLLSNEYAKLPLPIPGTGEVRPDDLGGSKGWVILWPKVLIRAEPAGATPTQGNATFTPPMQFPSFGLGDHGSGREGGSTVLVAHHAPLWIHHLIRWRMRTLTNTSTSTIPMMTLNLMMNLILTLRIWILMKCAKCPTKPKRNMLAFSARSLC